MVRVDLLVVELAVVRGARVVRVVAVGEERGAVRVWRRGGGWVVGEADGSRGLGCAGAFLGRRLLCCGEVGGEGGVVWGGEGGGGGGAVGGELRG